MVTYIFSFFFNVVDKKCRENGIDRLRNGQLPRRSPLLGAAGKSLLVSRIQFEARVSRLRPQMPCVQTSTISFQTEKKIVDIFTQASLETLQEFFEEMSPL